MAELLEHPWIVEGLDGPLEKMNTIGEIAVLPEEIKSAVMPIHRVVFVKGLIKHWKSKIKKKE
jgi:hypothetical protein